MDKAKAFAKFAKQLQRWYAQLPYKVSVLATNDIQLNFTKRHGYYSNGAFIKWADRKTQPKNKRAKQRGILIKSGRLLRSIRPAPLSDTARVITDVPYAQVHNEGFTGVQYVKPHKRTATRKIKIRGSYGQMGDEKRRRKTMKIQGERHNVQGFGRRMKMPKRTFMQPSKHFFTQLERDTVKQLETMFKNAIKQ